MAYVADFRAAVARRGPDAEARALVDALLAASEEFRAVWALQEVAVKRATRKVLNHERVGRLDLECDVVVSPPSGQHLVLFRARPGHGHRRAARDAGGAGDPGVRGDRTEVDPGTRTLAS